jgi:glyoxylase-like metal-dependent hydrolase (beta-lactamase superfamily II)
MPHVYALAEFEHVEKVISYLVVGDSQALLFDTGLGKKSIHNAIKTITKLPVTIFLTHSHWDHVGGVIKRDTVFSFANMRDWQHLSIDGITVQCVYTPGHTPDSVCYYLPEMHLLLLGDTFYPGPLYAHLPESNINDYAKSLSFLASKFSATTRFFPGHNAISCSHSMIQHASQLMKQVANLKQIDIHEVHGDGFSIRF